MVDEQNNVTSINSKKKNKKKDDTKSKPKITRAWIEKNLLEFLETGKVQQYMNLDLKYKDDWDVWFYRKNPTENSRILVINKHDKTACEIGIEYLSEKLIHKTGMFVIEDDPCSIYGLAGRQATEFARAMLAVGRKIKQWPKPIGFKSSPGYFFKRHDFDPVRGSTPDQFPTINLNLEHMTNHKSFCQRVGSLYDDKADRKQIIFMVGEGDGGKSALINLLTDLAGGADGVSAVSMNVFSNFGFDPLLDKRVWIAEELSPQFFKNDKYKVLTGGSPVQINRKGERQFNAYLDGMLFCASNRIPDLENDSGLRNRLIICEVETLPAEKRLSVAETRKRMREELKYFVGYCQDLYDEVGEDGTLVPESTEKLESIIAESEMDCEMVFDEYFIEDLTKIGKDAVLAAKEYNKIWEQICNDHPQFAKTTKKKTFNKYTANRLGRSEVSQRVFGYSHRMIPGLRRKK
jgi:phage/plasmid-associated DNA primase